MSYTSPTITASSETLAGLKTHGHVGQISKLAAANSFNANVTQLLGTVAQGQAQRLFGKISNDVSNYLSGSNESHATIAQALLDYATVLKTLLASVEEIAVLEAAATRGTSTTINGAGTQANTVVTLS